jgi:hypothetical protein
MNWKSVHKIGKNCTKMHLNGNVLCLYIKNELCKMSE